MKKILTGFAVLVAFWVSSCTTPSKMSGTNETQPAASSVLPDDKKKEFEYFFIEALKQKVIGNPQKAVSLLSACIEIDPNSSAAMYELANLHVMNKDLTSASLLLEKAIQINPDNKWYTLLLARIYQQTGKESEAAALFDQLTRLEPENQEYLYLKALQLAKAKRYDESVKTLNELEKKAGVNEQLSLTKQEILFQGGKIKEAFEEIEKLIRANPGDPRYYGLLADMYKDQGDKENALRYYQKILDMDAENGFVNFSLSDYYLEEGDTVRAFEYAKKGFASNEADLDTKLQLYLLYTGENARMRLSSEQNAELVRILGEKHPDDFRVTSLFAEYLLRNNQVKEAREQLLKVIEGGQNDFMIWQQLLFIDNDLQDWQALYDHARQSTDLFPNQAQFHFFRAIAALQLEKFEEAITIVDEGLNYVVEDPGLKGQFLFLKGEATYKMNKLPQAFKLFDEALEINPENFIAMNNYAYYLSLAGVDLEKAERMSGKVIARYPDNSTYLDTYAWVLFRKKDYALAKFYMETALKYNREENATLVEHYGDILFMLGDVEGALKNWQNALELGSDSTILKQKIVEKKYIPE